MPPLPITPLLPDVVRILEERGAIVVVAPPGSGKTTRIPPAILDAGCAGAGRVVVLQPRRVAARLAARRMAAERGVCLGAEVGYRVRFESHSGPETRIEVLTEGLLTRRMQVDPFLDGVGCVVLDEFHERSLHADLGLAMLREIREGAREDLRIVVMSATLDPTPVAAFLGGPQKCGILVGDGAAFPVEVRYLERPDDRPISLQCAGAVRGLLRESGTGHVLVFLPGVGEIRRTGEALAGVDAQVIPLHGQLPGADQDLALAPSAFRKVVLATNIAETSVTLDGVWAVVDGGLHREPVLDPALGLERLETLPISRWSADQRAGRAGRTGPGVCVRLWTRAAHHLLPESGTPEVRRADLARTVMELWAWGADPHRFRWYEAPPEAHIRRAESLLASLGALGSGGLSPEGRRLLDFPVHPRLARVILAGEPRLAATLAALASEPDPFFDAPPEGSTDSDLGWRLEAVTLWDSHRRAVSGTDMGRLQNLLRVRDKLLSLVGFGAAVGRGTPQGDECLARLLLAGFPDRVGVLHASPAADRSVDARDRYVLVGGQGAILDRCSVLRGQDLILAVGLEAGPRGPRSAHRIRVACALDPTWLPLREETALRFDSEKEAVIHGLSQRYLDLEIGFRPGGHPDPEQVALLLSRAAKADPSRAFDVSDDLVELLARLRFLGIHVPEEGLPAFWRLDALMDEWCVGRSSFGQLRSLDLAEDLRGRLGFHAMKALDRLAPTHLRVPSGSFVRLRWPLRAADIFAADSPSDVSEVPPDSPLRAPPVLAARVQQLFGQRETPRIADGRVAVLVELQAPNHRAVQRTQDLESFWSHAYAEVRKDLRGRYPRHPWPEDPWTALPTDRATRRRPGI